MKPDYSFQELAVSEAVDNLQTSNTCLLACAPASGKTEMAIAIIESMDVKTMILAHGTTVLKKQFASRLSDKGIIHGEIGSNLTVELPQRAKNYKNRVELLVVDEAHHFYKASMVQKIIKDIRPKYILALTGSPGIFNETKEFESVYVSSEELRSYGVINSPQIELYPHDFKFTVDSLQKRTDELKGSVKFGSYESVSKIINTLTSGLKGKTIIVCKDISHADQVSKALGDCLSSHHHNDPESRNIERFRVDPKEKYLVVVRRATLGFSMNELINIVDFSGSINIDFQYQLLNRVTRLGNKNKRYIKICDSNLFELYHISLNAACSLLLREYYSTYTRNNIKKTMIPIRKTTSYVSGNGKPKKASISKSDLIIDMDFLIKHHKDGSMYSTTSVDKVREIYHRKKLKYTLEEALEEAKKFPNMKEFKANKVGAYNWLITNNKEELYKIHQPMRKYKWNLKDAVEELKKYSSRSEMMNTGLYMWFRTNHPKILDKYLPKTLKTYNLTYLKKEVNKAIKKGESRKQFALRTGGLCNWAKTNGHTHLLNRIPSKVERWNKKTAISDLKRRVKNGESKCDLHRFGGGLWLKKNGYIKEFRRLVPPKFRKPKDIERNIIKNIGRCSSLTEYRKKYPNDYAWVLNHRKNRLLKNLDKRIILKPNDKVERNNERLIKEVSKYTSITQLHRDNNDLYHKFMGKVQSLSRKINKTPSDKRLIGLKEKMKSTYRK